LNALKLKDIRQFTNFKFESYLNKNPKKTLKAIISRINTIIREGFIINLLEYSSLYLVSPPNPDGRFIPLFAMFRVECLNLKSYLFWEMYGFKRYKKLGG